MADFCEKEFGHDSKASQLISTCFQFRWKNAVSVMLYFDIELMGVKSVKGLTFMPYDRRQMATLVLSKKCLR